MIKPFIHLDDVEEKEPMPGLKGRFVHSDNMTVAHWNFEAGSVLPEHAHPHEQIANIIEGEFELTVNGESKILGPGSIVVIASNLKHSGRSVTNSRIVDVFYPVREDYR